jgi:hypothetical protein
LVAAQITSLWRHDATRLNNEQNALPREMAWPQVGLFAEDRRRLHHTADIQASRRISRVPNHYVCLRGSSKGRWRLSDPNCPDTWAVGAETSAPADVRPDGVFPLGSLLVPCEPRGVIVIPRMQTCRMAERHRATPIRVHRPLPVQLDGRRIPNAQNRTVLEARNEATSDISR